jgi:hypothetical protein
MPVLIIPLAWAFDRWRELRPELRVLLLAIVAASASIQLWAAVTDPVGDRGAIWPLIGGNENESIYVPQVGPWGVSSAGGPDLLWWRLWRTEPNARPMLACIVAMLIVISGAGVWLAGRSLGLRADSLEKLLPTMRPIELFAATGALVLFAVPSIVESWLLRGDGGNDPVPAARLPATFRRLQRDRAGVRLDGKLFIPIKGDYTFYQQGPPGTQIFLDGRPVFRGPPAELGSGVSDLDVGFHGLAGETRAAGQFNTLYWTTPGNAHYKEPIPERYLAGPTITWRDRLAIHLAHSKWVVWVAALVLFLAVYARPNRPANCGPPARQTLAPGENG